MEFYQHHCPKHGKEFCFNSLIGEDHVCTSEDATERLIWKEKIKAKSSKTRDKLH